MNYDEIRRQKFVQEMVTALGMKVGSSEKKERFARTVLERLSVWSPVAVHKHENVNLVPKLRRAVNQTVLGIKEIEKLVWILGPEFLSMLSRCEHEIGQEKKIEFKLERTIYPLKRLDETLAHYQAEHKKRRGKSIVANQEIALNLAELYYQVFERLPSAQIKAYAGKSNSPYERCCRVVSKVLCSLSYPSYKDPISQEAMRRAVVRIRDIHTERVRKGEILP